MPDMLDSPPAAEPASPSESSKLGPLSMYMDLLADFKEGAGGPKNLLYMVASWHVMLRIFKWIDDRFPFDDASAHRIHSELLDTIIAVGIALQRQAAVEKVVLSKEDHGTTMEQMQANLDWLRDKRSMCHGDVTPKRKAAIIQSLFGDAAA